MKRLLIILLLSIPAFATNHYVVAGISGTHTGVDWSTAYSSIPSSLTRGDTYYVAGGSYGTLTLADSGTSVTTIIHPTQFNHGTDTGWVSTYTSQAVFPDIEINASDYTIDGQLGGGPQDWACTNCGFKVAMPISGGQAHAVGVTSANVSNITLRHMDFAGRGRTYCTGSGCDTDIFYFLNSYTNFYIGYSYLHDTDRTMMLTWPSGGSGMTLEYDYFTRNGTAEHREAWSLSTDSNVIVRYNLFEQIWGTGVIAAVNGAGSASNWQIYGNVFYWTGIYTDANGTGIIDTGVITMAHSNCPTSQCIVVSNYLIYNNIIAGLPNSGSVNTSGFDIESISGSPGAVCENNIWYNNKNSSGQSGCTEGNSAPSITTADYNWFYGNTGNGTSGSHDIVGSASPFSTATTTYFPYGNWQLIAHIAGLSQASTFTTDGLGSLFTNPSSFDRGAFEYVGSTDCANLQPSSSLACQQIASGALSPWWTVGNRHGEYGQSEEECNIGTGLTTGTVGLTITTTSVAYTCGNFNPTTGAVATSPASWPFTTGMIEWTPPGWHGSPGYSFQYGTIVWNQSLPNSNTQLWPALWMMGTNCQSPNLYTGDPGTGGCPAFGATGYAEADLLECDASHWCDFELYNPGNVCGFNFAVSDTSFHTYVANWQSSGWTLSKDGTQVGSCSTNISTPMFLIDLIQAGGIGNPTNLPASTVTPYIKVCNSTLTASACQSAANTAAGVIFYDNFGASGSTASAPSCTPTSGNVPQTVTCTNPNSGTTILCYAASPTTPATNGSGTACSAGTQYTTALSIVFPETLNVIAGVAGDTDSSVVSYTYNSAAATGLLPVLFTQIEWPHALDLGLP